MIGRIVAKSGYWMTDRYREGKRMVQRISTSESLLTDREAGDLYVALVLLLAVLATFVLLSWTLSTEDAFGVRVFRGAFTVFGVCLAVDGFMRPSKRVFIGGVVAIALAAILSPALRDGESRTAFAVSEAVVVNEVVADLYLGLEADGHLEGFVELSSPWRLQRVLFDLGPHPASEATFEHALSQALEATLTEHYRESSTDIQTLPDTGGLLTLETTINTNPYVPNLAQIRVEVHRGVARFRTAIVVYKYAFSRDDGQLHRVADS